MEKVYCLECKYHYGGYHSLYCLKKVRIVDTYYKLDTKYCNCKTINQFNNCTAFELSFGAKINRWFKKLLRKIKKEKLMFDHSRECESDLVSILEQQLAAKNETIDKQAAEIERMKRNIALTTVDTTNIEIQKYSAEIERMKEERNSDLYLEFGDGKILVLTSKDNKIILSKQHGRGEIGEKVPIKEGDTYIPSSNDVVMKFKNLAAIRAVKTAVENIEAALEAEERTER